MLWLGVWTVLVLVAVAVLGVLGYGIFRKGVALVQQLGEAAEVMSRAAEQLDRLHDPADVPELAVFADPHELRERHEKMQDNRRRARRMRSSRTGGR